MTVGENHLSNFLAFLYIMVLPQIFLHILHNSARPHFPVGFFLRWGGGLACELISNPSEVDRTGWVTDSMEDLDS